MTNLFTNLMRIFTSEPIGGGCARTMGIETPERDNPDNPSLQADITALQEAGYSLCQGATWTINLHVLLEICPRKRRRIDAYVKLTKYLKKEYNINLQITSRKSKYNTLKNKKNETEHI